MSQYNLDDLDIDEQIELDPNKYTPRVREEMLRTFGREIVNLMIEQKRSEALDKCKEFVYFALRFDKFLSIDLDNVYIECGDGNEMDANVIISRLGIRRS